MSKRKIMTVKYDEKSELWKGQVAGNERASFTGGNKEEVSQKMAEKAKAEGNAQLRIYKKDKPGYEERTYGKDPFPPKG
jgi:hypothetical protein